MSDLGIGAPLEKERMGEDPPPRGEIDMHAAQEAQQLAKEAHAYATTAAEDPPIEMSMDHHPREK